MSFYSWFLDLMHWKVKQKKCRSVCYHRKPQKCDQCNRRKSVQSTAAWSLCCSAIAMQWDSRHGVIFIERGEYLKIQCMPCTWHQKMVIAWDEVVRVWRDMAPGLVFCDTSLHIHPCYHRGGEGSMEKEGKRIGRGNIGFAWNSGCPCRAILPFHRTSWLNVFNT